ncbi:MAG TPA: HupE/UreJ family protein [Polyangia bacterium]|jgi:hydrogenase/urease accessory protein HupE|nr:HupE/UreJ family protein [Polyangia bacterium]
MTGVAGRALGAAAIVCAATLAGLVAEHSADAHTVGFSSGEYRLDRNVLYGDLGMANRELARLLPAIDTNNDGLIDTTELDTGRDALARRVAGGITVRADGKACPGSIDRAWVQEEDGGAVFQVRYTCAAAPGRLTLAMPMLESLAPGHRHMARVFRAGTPAVTVLDRAHATWTLDDATRSSRGGGGALAGPMLKLGVEHILTGWDHLLFLLGLILVAGRLRALVGVVTAFTVAHSITLALAALSVFAPSPRLVEPAIALSIAYVGVENFFVTDARKRWRITFPFGLVHGFGFAAALREIALPRAQIPIALVTFNIGVEIGQLAVLLAALPVVLTLRRAAWFGDRGVKVASATIAAAGAALFIARLAAQ